MTLPLQSSRFGAIDVEDDAVLEFPRGLIGLGGSRYALVAHGPDSAFSWLQSCEDPELALPVVSPWAFFPDFELRLAADDAEHVGRADTAGADVYVTVRVAEGSGFAANLAAPIVVLDGTAHQVLNQARDEFRAPLFA